MQSSGTSLMIRSQQRTYVRERMHAYGQLPTTSSRSSRLSITTQSALFVQHGCSAPGRYASCSHHQQHAAVDELRLFPFLDDNVTVNALKQELPAFRAAAEDVTGVDPAKWWKDHADELPSWSSAAAEVLLIQPSSAAAERVFSLLQQAFQYQQDQALEDYVEASIMVQYNGRKKTKTVWLSKLQRVNCLLLVIIKL